VHALPPVPQAPAAVPGWHPPAPSQQPVAQLAALHAPQVWLPALQATPAGQSAAVAQPQRPEMHA
jgi:hypothetical protein